MLIRSILIKALYSLYFGKNSNISYFKVFGYKYFILNSKENLKKFRVKSNKSIFLGYSTNNKVYCVL